MIELLLGTFETPVAAAVAEDLAARLIGEDAPNFEDADFEKLLLVFGEAVVEGLNWNLPGGLADEMTKAVREVMAKDRRPSLYEQLTNGNRWN